MKYLQGLTVLVLGLGDSGLAMARWCARCGAAEIRVWDSRAQPPQLQALREAVPAAGFHTGAIDAAALLDGVRLVLKSPGLAPRDGRIAPLLDQALDKGALVQGELDLFNRALADLKAERGYAPQVLAITGTNGKTTTTSLAALLVERAGRRVAMAGNIGPTMLDTLAQALDLEPPPADDSTGSADATPAAAEEPSVDDPQLADTDAFAQAEVLSTDRDEDQPEALAPAEDAPHVADTDAFAGAPVESTEEDAPLQLAPPARQAPVFEHLPQVWVLELSSFQLHEAKGFEPSAAAVLNLTQDHLDWHGDMPAYATAKARVFGQQAVMVVNRDDPAVEAMVPAPLVVKGAKGRPAKTVARKVVRFGLDAPRHPGDYGLVVENGMAWLVRAMDSDEPVRRNTRPPGRRSRAASAPPNGGAEALGRPGDFEGEEEEIILQRLMPADALRIRGRHNAANALAALALVGAIGCPLAPMLHGLREYAGEPHRVEFIGSVGGIEAFDDSKGTNVGATVAALKGLGDDKAPNKLLVVLGGDGKGQDFSPLAEPLRRHARAAALIGRDAAAIETALQAAGVPMQRHDTLEAATRWCFEQAQGGDAVLLSPACASLDMFHDYKHRAEVFVEAVRSLAAERGEVLS